MNRTTRMIAAALLALIFTGHAKAQVVSLLVGNQSGFSGLDRYDGTTGAYIGSFGARPGNGQFSYFTYGGPNNNLFVQQGVLPFGVLQFDGQTGSFINNFISDIGAGFTFGPDGHCYRLELFSETQSFPRHIGKYDGNTGSRIGTFVDGTVSGINAGSGSLRFGPDGNLYVDNGNTMLRFDGATGTPMGQFIPPGSGGLLNVFDAVFASNGHLIVSGINGTTNDTLWRFDGATGEFLGVFASGNGLDGPIGITEGPDGLIYVSSIGNSQIKRFDLVSGAFVNNFITVTAHEFPSHLVFSSLPVPEPTSLALFGLFGGYALGAGWHRYVKLNAAQQKLHHERSADA